MTEEEHLGPRLGNLHMDTAHVIPIRGRTKKEVEIGEKSCKDKENNCRNLEKTLLYYSSCLPENNNKPISQGACHKLALEKCTVANGNKTSITSCKLGNAFTLAFLSVLGELPSLLLDLKGSCFVAESNMLSVVRLVVRLSVFQSTLWELNTKGREGREVFNIWNKLESTQCPVERVGGVKGEIRGRNKEGSIKDRVCVCMCVCWKSLWSTESDLSACA